MKLHKFAIKVDMSTFFDDERKFVLILVDPAWESVELVQQRILSIFGRSVQFLSADDCFIPPQEPVGVLKFVESIKAILPLDSLPKAQSSKKENKLKRKRALAEERERHAFSAPSEMFEDKKKRKYLSPKKNLSSSTPNHSKRSNNIENDTVLMIDAVLLHNKSNEITSTSEALNHQKQCNEVNRTLIGPVRIEVSPPQDRDDAAAMEETCSSGEAFEEALEPQMAKETESKRKRKRSHKKKSKAESFNQLDNSCSMTKFATLSHLPSSTILNQSQDEIPANGHMSARELKKLDAKSTAVNLSVPNGSHIYYDEFGDFTFNEEEENKQSDSIQEEIPKPVVLFQCALTIVSHDKPRLFVMRQKEPIEIREHLVLRPGGTPNCSLNGLLCGQPNGVTEINKGFDLTATSIGNGSSEHKADDNKHLRSESSQSQLPNVSSVTANEQEEGVESDKSLIASPSLTPSLNFTQNNAEKELSVQRKLLLNEIRTNTSLNESSVIEVDTNDDDDDDEDCLSEHEGSSRFVKVIDLS